MSRGVEVTPAVVRFQFQPNKQLLTTLAVTNPNNQRVAFKIKTTAAKEYVVRPVSGVIDARSAVAILVVKRAHKEYTAELAATRDRFMVQSVGLGDTEQVDDGTFGGDAREDVRELRLQVVVEGPATASLTSADCNTSCCTVS